MATADLTVIGLGRADPSAGEYIAEIQQRLAAQDRVRFRLHAMGTELEGTVQDILAVVGELHRVPLEMGLPRSYMVLKLDERTDKEQTLDDKVRSVEKRLGPPGSGSLADGLNVSDGVRLKPDPRPGHQKCRGWDSNPHAPKGHGF